MTTTTKSGTTLRVHYRHHRPGWNSTGSEDTEIQAPKGRGQVGGGGCSRPAAEPGAGGRLYGLSDRREGAADAGPGAQASDGGQGRPDEDGLVIKSRKSGLGALYYRMLDNASALMKKLSGTLTAAEDESDHLGDAWRKLTGDKGIGRFLLTLLSLLAILAAGLLLRWLLFRSTRDIRERLFASGRLGRLEFFGRVLSRLILEALGVAVFAVTTFILVVVFFQKGDVGYEFVSVYLLVSYYVLILAGAAKVIFSPDAPALRLSPMKDADAAFLYRWILYIISGAAVISGASTVMGEIEANKALYLMFYSLSGAYIALALIVMIWQSRQRITEAILPANAEAGKGGPRAAFARYWHYLASVYVLIMGLFLGLGRPAGGQGHGLKPPPQPVRDPGLHRHRPMGAATCSSRPRASLRKSSI